jgi:two-component sensor histidine kinase
MVIQHKTSTALAEAQIRNFEAQNTPDGRICEKTEARMLKQIEDRARRMAKSQGLMLRKARRQWDFEYRYRVVDPYFNMIVFKAPAIEEIIDFLS